MTNLARRSLLASAIALSLGSRLARAATPGSRELPNILWLVSEDHNPDLGCYGNRLVRTPNLDSLAKRGVLFRQAYCTAPVCAPSRFTLLTGMYPQTCSPAQEMSTQAAKLPDEFKTYPEFMREAGYYCTNNSKTGWNCDRVPARIFDDSSAQGHWRNRPAGKPFMAVFTDMTSHESSLFRGAPGRVQPAEVTVPRYLPDTPQVRSDIATYYNRIEDNDVNVGKRLAELEADGLSDDTIIFFYADNGGDLPRTKRYAFQRGFHCPLIVYAPPKWQHLLGLAPGSEVTTPVSFADLVPTLLHLIGQPKPAHMQGQSLFGSTTKPQDYAFGMRNRMDERYDFVRSMTDGRFRYTRNYTANRPACLHGAFSWQAKGYQSWERERIAGRLSPAQRAFLTAEGRRFEEFYDLQADPDQVANLIDDPSLAARISQMRAALDRHMVEIHDNGFIPEGSEATGYHQSRDPAIYPLPRLMELGRLAGQRDSANIGQFRKGLADTNYLVRYWSAQGLLMLGKAAQPAKDDLVRMATSDSSEHVQVVAAEAIAALGETQRGVERLAAIVDADRPFPIRLQAANALTFIGESARAALPSIQRLAKADQEYLMSAGRYLEAVLTGTYTPESQIWDPMWAARRTG